jgi:hypothetical protein
MRGYEKHEFSEEMLKPAPEGLVDPMVVYREMLALLQPETRSGSDIYVDQVIEQVQRARRIAEREELRPLSETPVSAKS